jgi:hypothetical protein
MEHLRRTAASSSANGAIQLLSLADADGRSLSPARNERCQAAISDALERQARSTRLQIYADPLTSVRLAPLNGTDDVRIVYFIGVGIREAAHLIVSRLIYALHAPSHLFLIHVDVKAGAKVVDACTMLGRQYPNVHVLGTRRLVQWGMFSMVAPALDAIKTVLTAGLRFDFFINLSDADLALRTDAEMRSFLQRMRGRSLIHIHENDREARQNLMDDNVVIECGGYGFVAVNRTPATIPLTDGCCIGRSGPAAFGRLPFRSHRLFESKSAHTGSQWVVLAREFCQDLFAAHTADWISAFERRLVPDESFFQTIAMHSPRHKHSLISHNLRWIEWETSDLGMQQQVGGPRVVTLSDLPRALASPYMFARKVEATTGADVLRRWDTWMARKLGGVVGHSLTPPQAPIGHSPLDPQLSKFRAPGVERRLAYRRVAKIQFEDGSHCECGDGCGALSLPGGCCDGAFCA